MKSIPYLHNMAPDGFAWLPPITASANSEPCDEAFLELSRNGQQPLTVRASAVKAFAGGLEATPGLPIQVHYGFSAGLRGVPHDASFLGQ